MDKDQLIKKLTIENRKLKETIICSHNLEENILWLKNNLTTNQVTVNKHTQFKINNNGIYMNGKLLSWKELCDILNDQHTKLTWFYNLADNYNMKLEDIPEAFDDLISKN